MQLLIAVIILELTQILTTIHGQVGLYTDITSNSTFVINVSPGGNITVSCNRVCGQYFYDRWLLQMPQTSKSYTINEGQTKIKNEFEKDTGVELFSSNSVCSQDGAFIEYFIRISNISQNVTGLLVTCGARRTDQNTFWYASHSSEIIVDNVHERLAEASRQLDTCQQNLDRKNRTCTTRSAPGTTDLIIAIVILVICILVLAIALIACTCSRLVYKRDDIVKFCSYKQKGIGQTVVDIQKT